jgi:hypothetical protein
VGLSRSYSVGVSSKNDAGCHGSPLKSEHPPSKLSGYCDEVVHPEAFVHLPRSQLLIADTILIAGHDETDAS